MALSLQWARSDTEELQSQWEDREDVSRGDCGHPEEPWCPDTRTYRHGQASGPFGSFDTSQLGVHESLESFLGVIGELESDRLGARL